MSQVSGKMGRVLLQGNRERERERERDRERDRDEQSESPADEGPRLESFQLIDAPFSFPYPLAQVLALEGLDVGPDWVSNVRSFVAEYGNMDKSYSILYTFH